MLGDRVAQWRQNNAMSVPGASATFPARAHSACCHDALSRHFVFGSTGAEIVTKFASNHFADEIFLDRIVAPKASDAGRSSTPKRLEHYVHLSPYNWFNFTRSGISFAGAVLESKNK